METPESVPAWLVKGKVIMLPKSDKTRDPSRFKSIACFTTWKTLTEIVASMIETHLNTHNIMYPVNGA